MRPPAFLRAEWDALGERFAALRGFRLVVDTRPRRRLGQCRWGTREVAVSSWILADERQAIQTLRHEAAHVLAGPRAKHGPEWKRWARHLGVPAESCTVVSASLREARDEASPPKWRGECGCRTWYKRRIAARHQNAGWRCRACGVSFEFVPNT